MQTNKITKCWNCKGCGRIRRDPISAAEWIFTLGYMPIIRMMLESDKMDDRDWRDCNICKGKGYIDASNSKV